MKKRLVVIINPDFIEDFDLVQVVISEKAEQDCVYYVEDVPESHYKEIERNQIFGKFCSRDKRKDEKVH